MRIYEILNTEEKLVLWQTISDTVFAALIQNDQQAANQQTISQRNINYATKANPPKPTFAKPSIRAFAKPIAPVSMRSMQSKSNRLLP